jgi:Uncharacterized conserved protein, contains double-stranded beta-helix domain
MAEPARPGATPVAEAFRVVEMIAPQPGAVVSRTLVKQEKGTVTLFAFDAGQGLSEHTAPFDALVHVLEGEADVTVAGKPIRARTGDMVLMPAHQPHALHAPAPFKMLLTMIRA